MLFRCFTILTVLLAAYYLAGCRKNVKPGSADEVDYETLPAILTPFTEDINSSIGGYYSGVPAGYATSNKKYPLLVFIHGGGQFGNGQLDLPIILNEGIPELLDEQIFPPDFSINGEHFSFFDSGAAIP